MAIRLYPVGLITHPEHSALKLYVYALASYYKRSYYQKLTDQELARVSKNIRISFRLRGCRESGQVNMSINLSKAYSLNCIVVAGVIYVGPSLRRRRAAQSPRRKLQDFECRRAANSVPTVATWKMRQRFYHPSTFKLPPHSHDDTQP